MRKRNAAPVLLRTAVILAILICLTAALGAVPARADNSAGTVTASALNMRSGPSTAYSVVTCVPRGTQVIVTGSSNGWYQVQYQNMSGYMAKDYVSLSSSASGSFGTGTVKGTYVNVRSGPGLGYSVIGSTNTGDSYTVTGVSDSWYKINFNNTTGYIFNSYLTLSGSSSSGSSNSGSSNSGSSSGSTSSQGTGVITGDYVRMRSGPSTSYSILGTYMNGTKMTVTGTSGDWYAVTYNGTKGYVYKQYLSQSGTATNVESMNNTAAVTTTAVHLREGPSTAYTSKRVMPQGASITLTGKSGQWYRCTYNGESGFVYGDYVTTNVSTAPPASSVAGDKIVAEAKKYLGVRYVYGGATPSGFDCSGFVYYVYRQCGYSITRTATAQNSVGASVARGDMQPGDIIIFYNGAKSAIGHSGIYIGNNQFIHASSGGGKVMISGLNETYYNTRFYSARRVVK